MGWLVDGLRVATHCSSSTFESTHVKPAVVQGNIHLWEELCLAGHMSLCTTCHVWHVLVGSQNSNVDAAVTALCVATPKKKAASQ